MANPKSTKNAKPAKSGKLASKVVKAKPAGALAGKIKNTKVSRSSSKLEVLNAANSWLQDATLEAPVPPQANFVPGSRELEFSVGMRQQDIEGLVRSELRGRALVHTQGQVLALAEASYVHVGPQSSLPEDLPQQLYGHLRPQLERLLALGGHTPPLPASLDKIT